MNILIESNVGKHGTFSCIATVLEQTSAVLWCVALQPNN